MSLTEVLRTKRLWIAPAASVATLILSCALGAMLVLKGVISEDGQFIWSCACDLAAALIGGLIACKGQKGSMLFALSNTGLVMILVLLSAWIVCGGVSLSNGGWKLLLFTAIGGLIAGLLGAKRGKRGKTKRKPVFVPKRQPRHR